MLSLTSLCLALPLLLPAPDDKPDLVVLEGGKEIPCRVLFEDDERVVYKAGRKVTEVERAKVAEVQSIERSLRTFLERYSELDPTNVAALTDLAVWAESRDLPGESRNLWIRVLLLDPENEQAWTELGGSHGRRGWRMRVRGRYQTLEQLRERVSKWKYAMELPTAHFLVKTNIDPLRALDISIDIERIYLMYYDLFGQPMQLYPFIEIPELHVYGNTEDAPKPPQQQWTAWYEKVGNAVLVRGPEADRHEILRSITYLMITNSFRWAQGNRNGILPEWAREGLANSMAFALRPDPGKMKIETGEPYQPWFEAQAEDATPVTVKQMLNSNRGSFRTGPQEERFRRQAYTFAFFLSNSGDGKYTDRFVEYLRSAFDGKGSVKHFETIMKVKMEDLQQEWYDYVRGIAGK